MLRAQAVSKLYQDGKRNLEVLRGINLEVKKGDALSVVGPSGAGKSTLLHILGGIDRPTLGKVFLNNHDFYKLSENNKARLRNKCIGFVFQFYHLLSEFTAVENVLMPMLVSAKGAVPGEKGSKHGERPRDKAIKLLKRLGLENRLNHRPSELSGGEQQRVAIARAVINNPEIILCDEPTGNLDSKMGEKVLEILFELNKENNMAMIIVTHDRKIAGRAERIIEIKDGMLV